MKEQLDWSHIEGVRIDDESQVDTTGLTVPPQATDTSRLPVIEDIDPWELE